MPEQSIVAPNSNIRAYQLALPSLGIPYSGTADGIANPDFIRSMRGLEDLIQARTGDSVAGKILSGGNVGLSLTEVYRRWFPERLKSEPTSNKLIDKTDNKHDNKLDSIDVDLPADGKPNENKQDMNDAFKTLLSQDLPLVGRLYNGQGDPSFAAQTLESAIGKEIGKSMAGVIWNDQKKIFNTTPDDIRRALQMIQQHHQDLPKKVESTVDDRFILLSSMMLELKSESAPE